MGDMTFEWDDLRPEYDLTQLKKVASGRGQRTRGKGIEPAPEATPSASEVLTEYPTNGCSEQTER